MTRILTFAGLALTAAGGYALGRRGVDVRVAVNRALHHHSIPDAQTTEIALRVTRKPCYDTEFDHVAEREELERHRVAEELKSQPLHERRARRHRHAEDDLTTVASQPLTREREDVVTPRAY